MGPGGLKGLISRVQTTVVSLRLPLSELRHPLSLLLCSACSSGVVPAELEFPPRGRDRAAALAVARMCDTDLAAAVVYYRFVDEQASPCPTHPVFF